MVPLHFNMNIFLQKFALIILFFALPETNFIFFDELLNNGLKICGFMLRMPFKLQFVLIRLIFPKELFQKCMKKLCTAIFGEQT